MSSLEATALELAVRLAAAAAHAALDEALSPEHKAAGLDATANQLRIDANVERELFDAAGQRKLDARRKENP